MTDKIIDFLGKEPSQSLIKMAWKLFVQVKGFDELEFIIIAIGIDDVLHNNGRTAGEAVYTGIDDCEIDIHIDENGSLINIELYDHHDNYTIFTYPKVSRMNRMIIQTHEKLEEILFGRGVATLSMPDKLHQDIINWYEVQIKWAACAMLIECRKAILWNKNEIIKWFKKYIL